MNQYRKFKKWVQRKLDKFMVLWVVLTAIILIGLFNTDLSNVLGISTTKAPTIAFPTPTIQEFSPTPTYAPTPTIDPDPIVTCNISKECGGGSLQLRRSICSNSTCCGFYNGKWVFYESKAKCTQDQNTESTNARKSNYVPSQGTTQINTEPLITCVLSWGTYQLSQSSCDLFKSSPKPSESTVTCVLSYGTFEISQSTCDSYKSMDNSQNPTPTPDNSLNQQQNGQCKMYADQWYTNQGTQCSGSCAEAIKQLAYPEYQQKLKDCDSQYPI